MDATPPGPSLTKSSHLTEQQARAVEARDVSVVLSSGAGCGKTHVLTERYLSHLRENDIEVGQIVAITFTERAARQMRDRIRRAIQLHIRMATTEEEGERWSRHYRGLETAPISTIHAFCGTLLRQHAMEAELDPHFEVLEEVLAGCLRGQALTSCLQSLLVDESEVGGDLRQLILLYGWGPVYEAIDNLIQNYNGTEWEQWQKKPNEEKLQMWNVQAHQVLLPQYLEHCLKSRSKLSRLLPLLRRHPPLPGPMAENVELLLNEVPLLPQATNLGERAERLAEAAKVGRQGAKAWPDPAIYDQIKNAMSDFRTDLRNLKLERFDLDEEQAIGSLTVACQFLHVASAAYLSYQERKMQHGLVDFQDLLILARDLLRDHGGARAGLQDRYRYLLIDELQDTDPVQMEMIELLCGPGLTAGKLFSVGDHSQSIYRFRGADVHLFQELKNKVPHEGRQGLTVNFRSQPAILNFTNGLLGESLTAYEPLVAFHMQVNPEPCIEFLWSSAQDEDNATEARRREAMGIANRIHQMVDQEQLVVERDETGEHLRPVRPGDIVLLFRAMSNVHLYEAALRSYSLDYYLVGGRAFFAQQEIYDVLSLLRALENPQDEVSLAGALRSPFCCLSDEALFVLRYEQTGEEERRLGRRDLWTGLQDARSPALVNGTDRSALLRARDNLLRWRDLKDRIPIARLLGCILADSGYDASTQLEFLGDRKLANLWKLMEMARTFDRSNLFGLADFIERLGEFVLAQPREEQAATQPENANVIRLMTIHQAKGLEFPVVIIPDIDSSRGGQFSAVAQWTPTLGCVTCPPKDEDPPPFSEHGWGLWKIREEIEDWNESLRTLYVACTRAMDYLILSSAMKSHFKPSSIWMQLLQDRFDLFNGSPLFPETEEITVRVRDREPMDPPPTKTDESSLPVETAMPFAMPVEAQPISPRASTPTVLSLAEVLLDNGSVEPWFHSENGSDRSQWHSPRERARGSPASEAEALFLQLLQRWNWTESLDWQASCPESLSSENRSSLERWMGSLLQSPTFQQARSAAECSMLVELETPWPLELAQPLLVYDVIDCLWRDQKGWHLLALSMEAKQKTVRKKPWEVAPELIFQSWGVKCHCGAWPETITLLELSKGFELSGSGKRLPWRKTAQDLAQRLGLTLKKEKKTG